jgi:site-specific recombinase XerC
VTNAFETPVAEAELVLVEADLAPLDVLAEMQVYDPWSPDMPPDDRNPGEVYIDRLTTPKSRHAMRKALLLVVRLIEPAATLDMVKYYSWHKLRYAHCLRIRSRLLTQVARATVNHVLAALRGVVRESKKLKLISAEEASLVTERGSLPNIKGESLPAGRYVPQPEVVKLFEGVGEGAIRARNAALLAIMFGCGLRLAEVVGLEMKHYRHETNLLLVHGKGHKDRAVPVSEGTQIPLIAWLKIRGDTAGYIFLSASHHKGTVFKDKMTESAVPAILAWIAKRSGVAKLTPHDTRRTFISNIIDKTGDIAIAAKLAGHKSIETTKLYDRRPEAAERAAVNKLDIPYVTADVTSSAGA